MKTAILGYGKSGKSAVKALKVMGVKHIDIYDDKMADFQNISDIKDEYDMYVVSPGFDIKSLNIDHNKVISEIDLAYNLIDNDAKIIAITGTNGKSTITNLTAEILKKYGVKAKACGNIGFSFTDAVLEKFDIYVVELSSFQLDLIKYFKSNASCICNISEDHIDRYKTFDSYIDSKLRILSITRGELFAIEDELLKNRLPESTIFIDKELKTFPRLKGEILDFGNFFVDLDKFNLFGWHNKINLAFSLCLAESLFELYSDVTYLVENLSSLPHRCEFVDTIDNTDYINDSKGTNVDSTFVALNSLNDSAILILGGRDKGGDFTKLKDIINQKVKKLVLYGEAADIIESQLNNIINIEYIKTHTLKDAVKIAYELSKDIKIVLFSPACASFDQFKSFEERGEKFKEYVNELKGMSYAGK